MIGRLLAALVLAEASYRWIETPLRSGQMGKAWNNRRQSPRARWVWSSGLALAGMYFFFAGRAVLHAVPAPAPAFLTELKNQGRTNAKESTQPTFQTLSYRPAQSRKEVVSGAVAKSMEPASLGRWPGDEGLLLQGRVVFRNARKRTLKIAVRHFALRNGRGRVLRQVKTKLIVIPGDAEIRRQRRVPDGFQFDWCRMSRIKLGDTVTVIGVDIGAGRQLQSGVAILQQRQAAGLLPPIVIIHLGNNTPFSTRWFKAMMDALSGVPHVIILTSRVPKPYIARNNAVLYSQIRRYPNAVLADWWGHSNWSRNYFWDDGIHLRTAGRAAYTELIA